MDLSTDNGDGQKNNLMKDGKYFRRVSMTEEQRKTIEDALNSIPEFVRKGMYGTMEGVEEQLARGDKIIFYMRPHEVPGGFYIDKMKVSEDD